MLHEYRKKTTIKAEQFTANIKQIADYKVHTVGPTSRGDNSCFLLPTKEGDMKLNVGDWIATGIDGEHWVIADDIFKRTYERGGLMQLTERQKNCPYCHKGHKFLYNRDNSARQVALNIKNNKHHKNELIIYYKDKTVDYEPGDWTVTTPMMHYYVPIAYCPMCGRPLNEE